MRANYLNNNNNRNDNYFEKKINKSKKIKSSKYNKYKNAEWSQYDKYLSWKTGERIYMCSKVERERTFWSNQKRVLLLSSYEKIYMIDHKDGKVDQEWTRSMIQRVEVLREQKRFVIHLTNKKVWFRCIDNIDPKLWGNLITKIIFKVNL
eukprot:163011_1